MKSNGFVRLFGALTCAALMLALAPATGLAQQKYTFGIPGIPPVFGGTIALVAEKEGFFKKHGVDVTVRAFETGAAASRAVASGEIAVSLSPTPLIVNQISNTNVKLVGIWGMEHPDWLIGATDPGAECASMKGQGVGVDSLGGARSIALRTMLVGCKMKIEEVQQVPLSSNVGAAMVAGQLKFGVLHIDDIPVIEAEMKKPLKTIITQKQIRPVDHYLLAVANQESFTRAVPRTMCWPEVQMVATPSQLVKPYLPSGFRRNFFSAMNTSRVLPSSNTTAVISGPSMNFSTSTGSL